MKTISFLAKALLILVSFLQCTIVNSQVSSTYDFEGLTLNAPIHGQDNWFVESSHSSVNNGNLCPPAAGTAVAPDIILTTTSGSYIGSQALRNRNFGFGGQHSNISRVNDDSWSIPSMVGATGIVMEIDVAGNWWGKFFRLGYDSNGDNNFSSSCKTVDIGEVSLGLSVSGGNLRLHGANGSIISSGSRPPEWARLRLCIDVMANGGQGAGYVFYRTHSTSSTWIAHSISNVNMGLNSASLNQTNYQNLNGILLEQEAGGTGYFDNISIDVYYSSFVGCSVILPIELLDFQATAKENRWVNLKWRTASEKDNDYFEIYRSVDLENWERVAKVEGAGNSTELLNYSTENLNPHIGLSYYKLTQVDFDGTSTSGGIRSVVINPDLSIYPNPTSGELKITGNKFQLQNLQLFNSKSQPIKINILASGEHNITIDISNLSSGVYFLRSEEKTYKIVKE